MADKIKVFTKRPDGIPRSVWVTNSLKNLQNAVGGYIEAVTLAAALVVICNEEGRILGLQHNCAMCGVDFCGDIIIAGVRGDEFADVPVDIKELRRMFPQLWEVNGNG